MELFIRQLFEAPSYYISTVASFMGSICIHEYSHAFIAHWLGDNTAKENGYLTINPFKVMGWMSVLALFLFGISWGAVPVMKEDPNRFRRTAISLAGPMANLGLLALSSLILQLLYCSSVFNMANPGTLWLYARMFLVSMLYANAVLFLFNILPVPRLDGWGVVEPFLPKFLIPSPESQAVIFKLFIYVVCFSSASGIFGKGMEILVDKFMPSQVSSISLVVDGNEFFAEEKYDEAFKAFSSAAEQGNPEGMLGYAVCLADGLGCEAEPQKAFELFSKKEICDFTESKYYLGIMRMNGIGCEQDFEKAYALLSNPEVLEKYPTARACLGYLLIEGLGTPRDSSRAYTLFNDEEILASSAIARFYMACFLLEGEDCPADEKRAFELLSDSEVLENVTKANLLLGLCYYNGWGTNKDMNLARMYVQKAADAGDAEAVEFLNR